MAKKCKAKQRKKSEPVVMYTFMAVKDLKSLSHTRMLICDLEQNTRLDNDKHHEDLVTTIHIIDYVIEMTIDLMDYPS